MHYVHSWFHWITFAFCSFLISATNTDTGRSLASSLMKGQLHRLQQRAEVSPTQSRLRVLKGLSPRRCPWSFEVWGGHLFNTKGPVWKQCLFPVPRSPFLEIILNVLFVHQIVSVRHANFKKKEKKKQKKKKIRLDWSSELANNQHNHKNSSRKRRRRL